MFKQIIKPESRGGSRNNINGSERGGQAAGNNAAPPKEDRSLDTKI